MPFPVGVFCLTCSILALFFLFSHYSNFERCRIKLFLNFHTTPNKNNIDSNNFFCVHVNLIKLCSLSSVITSLHRSSNPLWFFIVFIKCCSKILWSTRVVTSSSKHGSVAHGAYLCFKLASCERDPLSAVFFMKMTLLCCYDCYSIWCFWY